MPTMRGGTYNKTHGQSVLKNNCLSAGESDHKSHGQSVLRKNRCPRV